MVQLSVMNPDCLVILDSEKNDPAASPKKERLKAKRKCQQAGIDCLLTERRATENYFKQNALEALYSAVPDQLDPYRPLTHYIPSFSKSDNGKIAAGMSWSELAETDVGQAIDAFLKK